MKHSLRRSLLLWPRLAGVAATSSCAVFCLSAATVLSWAAPPAIAQDRPLSDQGKRLQFLNNTLIPTVPKDFDAALDAFHQFVQANPHLDRYELMQVYSNSGNYFYFRTPENKRAAIVDKALGVLNEGLQYVNDNKDASPQDQERDIVELSHNKMQVLLAAKRYDEAAKVLDATWPMVMRWGGNLDNWCRYWREVRNQQKQPKQAVDGLIKAYEQRLPWRGESNTDISLPISDELLSQGRAEEALSWAKLSFMMCNFDQNSIRDATGAVTRALTAKELSVAKANAFAGAQTDPAAPNPLDTVPLPQLDTAAIRAQLAKTDLAPNVRLVCLLAVGDYKNAMLQARSRLMADVTSEDNARDIARVFKAKDADLARANGFLTYYQAGQGENPIPAFLKETGG